jgi:small subunit ribosomal protein S21
MSNAEVEVFDNNVDQAFKVLRKKLQREGIIREMKLRTCHEKRSEKRKRKHSESLRRLRKQERKRKQREGA